MKIRTPKDVEKLDAKIKEELGIDVQKYRNQEVVENFVELLVFPQYIFKWVLRPIPISFLIFGIGFFALDLVHLEYVIYTIVGLILFLLTGVLVGLLFLMWKLKTDIWGIVDYSLDIMKSAVNDLHQVNNQITAENRKEVLGLLFKGIIHIVTIPMLSQVIADKVPFVGGIVNGIVKRILILVSNAVKFDESNLNQELKKKEGAPNALQIYSSSITAVSDGLEKVMGFAFRVTQLPLTILFVIVFLVLVIFLYLIN